MAALPEPNLTREQTLHRRGMVRNPAKVLDEDSSFAIDLQQALGQSPDLALPSSTASQTWSEPKQPLSSNTSAAWPTPPLPGLPMEGAPPPRRSDTSNTNNAKNQCLHLCSDALAAWDEVAEKMSQYANPANNLPHEYITLTKEVLGVCEVLARIHAYLTDAPRHGQPLPLDVMINMSKKFRTAQQCLKALDHAVSKLLENTRKGRMRREWGNLFRSSSVEKVLPEVIQTHQNFKMGVAMFQWKLGSESECVDSALGIGFIALAAALELITGHAFRRSFAASGSDGKASLYERETAPTPQQHQQHHHNLESSRATTYSQELRPSLKAGPLYASHLSNGSGHAGNTIGSNAGWDSPVLGYAQSAISSYDDRGKQGKPLPYIESHLAHVETATISTAALDAIVEDILTLELDGNKVVRRVIVPSDMPHIEPSGQMDAAKPNGSAALVSAIRASDYRLAEQLLDRGVSPNSGSAEHALNDAISRRDAEAIRLLLLYGANPNMTDRDGQLPLAIACSSNQLEVTIALLKYGADPNLSSRGNASSPLAAALSSADVRLAHVLLMYGASPNQVAGCGDTPLIKAIDKTAPKILADLLLKYGAQANEKSTEGKTALFQAVSNGRADILASLIAHGADPNLPGPKLALWPGTSFPDCLSMLLSNGADAVKAPGIMELAASMNNITSIRILLKAGVNPNLKKDGVYTPLCTAIRDDRSDIVQLLLEHGADPNVPASEYPAFKCITHHRQHYLPALVAAGAKLDSPKGILEKAVASNNPTAIQWLLERGVDPNDKCPKGRTALTTAIEADNIEIVDLLLAHGANPNIRGQDWPVCMAVRYPEILKRILAVLQEPRAFRGVMEMAVAANQLESVKLLRAAGVSVEDRNGGVFSPLTTAIREYRTDIVAFLLGEGGADVNAPGEHLPIVKALRRCHTEHTDIIDMLLDSGADPNQMYREWNGIMQALENGDPAMLKKLVDKAGVDLEVRDVLGRSVTEIALSRGWQEAVDILLAARHKA